MFFVFTAVLAGVAPASADADMVKIPGGTFAFGPDKKKVSVKAFSIDRTEVTNDAYKKVSPEHEFAEGKGNHPVIEVSYDDGKQYCEAVGKRLPTGIEWERAARGDDGRIYPWGDTFSADRANTAEQGKDGTMEVGSFPKGASPYGVLDMCGNVTEWVDEVNEAKNQYRHRRGGSYFDSADNSAISIVSNAFVDDLHPYAGFRCVK